MDRPIYGKDFKLSEANDFMSKLEIYVNHLEAENAKLVREMIFQTGRAKNYEELSNKLEDELSSLKQDINKIKADAIREAVKACSEFEQIIYTRVHVDCLAEYADKVEKGEVK